MPSVTPIQVALAAESIANIHGALSIYYDPSSILSLLLPPTTPHSPALKAHAHWIAALCLGITPAFLLCIPNSGPHQTVARRNLYTTFMGFEALMVATAAYELVSGEFGITENGLYGTMAIFTFFTLLRVLFLYVKPAWMEGGKVAAKTPSKKKR